MIVPTSNITVIMASPMNTGMPTPIPTVAAILLVVAAVLLVVAAVLLVVAAVLALG